MTELFAGRLPVGLPEVITGAQARRAWAVIQRAVEELRLIGAERQSLRLRWHHLKGDCAGAGGPDEMIQAKIEQMASIGLDAEDAAALDELSAMRWDGGRFIIGGDGVAEPEAETAATP